MISIEQETDHNTLHLSQQETFKLPLSGGLFFSLPHFLSLNRYEIAITVTSSYLRHKAVSSSLFQCSGERVERCGQSWTPICRGNRMT